MTCRAWHIFGPTEAKALWNDVYGRGIDQLEAAGEDASWMRFDREHGLFPCCRFGVKNDAWIEALRRGAAACSGVSAISGSTVEFEDGSAAKIDVIVAATGFRPMAADFIDDPIVASAQRAGIRATLWRNAIPPREGPVDLAFLGLARAAFGGVPPVAELQARYVAKLFAGDVVAPTPSEMKADIDSAVAAAAERYPSDAARISTLVEFRSTLDEWGELLGATPSLGVVDFVLRPRVWRAVMFGPLNAAQYRLSSPSVSARVAATPLHPFMSVGVRSYLFWRGLLRAR